LRHFTKADSIRLEADFLETVRNMLEDFSIQPSGDDSVYIQAPAPDGHGWTAFIPIGTAGTTYKKPFDLTVASADSFEISDALTAQTVWYRSKRISTITAGAGLTFDTDHWSPTSAISASQYVWLEMDNSNAGATSIAMGTDMQADPDDPRYDYIEVFPLWFIPFADSAITESGIGDLRGSFIMSGKV
jgi:hypothetical protein